MADTPTIAKAKESFTRAIHKMFEQGYTTAQIRHLNTVFLEGMTGPDKNPRTSLISKAFDGKFKALLAQTSYERNAAMKANPSLLREVTVLEKGLFALCKAAQALAKAHGYEGTILRTPLSTQAGHGYLLYPGPVQQTFDATLKMLNQEAQLEAGQERLMTAVHGGAARQADEQVAAVFKRQGR